MAHPGCTAGGMGEADHAGKTSGRDSKQVARRRTRKTRYFPSHGKSHVSSLRPQASTSSSPGHSRGWFVQARPAHETERRMRTALRFPQPLKKPAAPHGSCPKSGPILYGRGGLGCRTRVSWALVGAVLEPPFIYCLTSSNRNTGTAAATPDRRMAARPAPPHPMHLLTPALLGTATAVQSATPCCRCGLMGS